MNRNFHREVMRAIHESNHTVEEISFISIKDLICLHMDSFWKTTDFDYDNESSGHVIHPDLRIVFKDGTWLSRQKDGKKEFFKYHRPHVHPICQLCLTRKQDYVQEED